VNLLLTFDPGETSKTVTVQVNGDTKVEPDETFTVVLSNPSGATIDARDGHRHDPERRFGQPVDQQRQPERREQRNHRVHVHRHAQQSQQHGRHGRLRHG
jgi:hypothetical protein